jgi:hypothetical protein
MRRTSHDRHPTSEVCHDPFHRDLLHVRALWRHDLHLRQRVQLRRLRVSAELRLRRLRDVIDSDARS